MHEVIEGFRTSPAQRRLFALAARGGGGQLAWAAAALRGPVAPDCVRAAVDAVVAGAEALRTVLVREPGSGAPLQVIGEHRAEWGGDEDWSGAPAQDVAAWLDAWVEDRLAAPVDPSQPPVLRAQLIRVAPNEHRLLLAAPAAIADAATLALLAAQAAAAYGGSAEDAEAMQFADVSEWQNEVLEGDDSAEGRRLWKQRLAAARGGVRLPHEAQPADGHGSAPRLIAVDTPGDLLPRLRAAAERIGVSVEAVALAAWAALLHRLTDQAQARIAAQLDGRALEELRGVMGPFARFLPLAVSVDTDRGMATVARSAEAALAEARRWQDAFDASPDEAVSPFGFAWQTLPDPIYAGGGEWALTDAGCCPEPFRAALLCSVAGDRLHVRLLHDPSRLPDDAAARLAEEAATVLDAVSRDPDAAAGALDVVGPGERAWLDARSTGPALDIAADETVIARILARADEEPGRVALRWEGGEATYGELRTSIDRLACHLRRLGAGPGTHVGILLDRGGDAVVAMLAVMRTGAAYAPLDPSFPRERLRFMLRDSAAAMLVTDDPHADLADEPGCVVVRIDADREAIDGGDGGAPLPAIDPRSAAYVIYTSGTTGQPKGTVVEHASLARYVRAAETALELPAGASYAVVSTLAADLGATMLFPALTRGGTLHVAPERTATDPEAWAAYAERHGIDCLKLVPSHLRLLLEAANPAAVLPRLRLVLGGESCGAELLRRIRALAPECRVFNHYGPTETTVGVVASELTDADAGDDAGPPLGRPLPGARIHVLDAHGRPAPAGVPGEVHVGGATVTRGYLGRPGLTAERFVPDPFAPQPGARMYRTGDRGRWDADGRLRFLGRLDEQVKVNGWRVEPAEVEAAIALHPTVAAVRVVPRGGAGETRLAAYVVPAPGARVDATELRRHLLERLPEPFVPADFVVLPRLPLTANGKVDVRALPEPADDASPEAIAPRTPVEAALAEVWQEVLGRAGVGATDDFFALGGNSFLAVRLMSRIHKRFGRRLPLAALIGAGTVERMARLVDGDGDTGAAGHLVTLREGGTLPPLVCVHPGEGTVLCYRDLARHVGDDRPVLGLQALDFEMGRAPLVEIEAMAARYVAALRERVPDGPYLLAGWSFGGLVAFEMARQLAAAGAEVQRVVLLDTRLPITAPALGRVDPVLHRVSMLFHGALLVRDGVPLVTAAELAGLGLHAQLALIAERSGVPAASLLPPHVPAEHVERYLDVRMARTRGVLAYAWRPAPVPLTLVRAGSVDLDSPFPELRDAFARAAASPDYGWGALTPHPVQVLDVEGTHHTLLREPHVAPLARQIDRSLAEPAVPVASDA